ncbi:MAG: hypothetical protein P4L33_21600 [Capsulimonadaceae bacterium]|nr:hypothetical protein [Capsulimonadaceae bacterium]
MVQTGKIHIGYLVSTAIAENVYMGGAMVTDAFGLPLEFRYTEPVKATRLQKILYGDVLEQYIQTDVIIVNILDNLEQKPSLFVVSDAEFLPALEAKGRTAIWLGEGRSAPLAEVGATLVVSDDEVMVQVSKTGGPIRVRFAHAGTHTESGVQTRAARQAEVLHTLNEAAHTMDVAEPLRRIDKALKLLWDEMEESPVKASE